MHNSKIFRIFARLFEKNAIIKFIIMKITPNISYTLLLLLFLSFLLPLRLSAKEPSRVPAYPGVIEKVQPNGDTLHVRLVGDERKHWTTTEDGYKIALNKRGYYCYLRNEHLTCRKAHDAAHRSKCEEKWLQQCVSRK